MKIRTLICALSLATAIGAAAQNGTMTPYSLHGYGILRDNATATQRQMGGTGYAMNSGRQINVMNPASYARIDSMTFLFDMGMAMTNLWSEETAADGTRNHSSDFGGGLDYITMQFPIYRGLGASIGLLPYSSVGYSFGSSIDNGASSHSGSGSINQLYAGLGYSPFKGFSLGVNVGYLFGNTYNDTYAITSGGSSSLFERTLHVSDWNLNAGVQYAFAVGRTDMISIGAVFTPGKNLHGTTGFYSYDTSADSETGGSEEDINGRYSTPWSLGAGVAYNWRGRLLVELDATYQPWSKAKYNGVKGTLNDRYKLAAGLQLVPNARGGYLRRTAYRAGAFVERDYLRVGNNSVRDYGVAAGVGLPVPGFKTVVSLGLEWRHRQGHPATLIKEDYLNITIGVNFNEMWFRPNKIY